MKKLIGILSFVFICIFSTSMIPSKDLNYAPNLCFSDLTEAEKKEVVSNLLSSGSCSWNGIDLYGKVEFVSSYADIKIQYVSSYGDIKVQMVDSYANECGKWQKVSSMGDFKVQVVDSYADIKVQLVDSYPGMN